MALAARLDARLKAAKKALATNVTVPAPPAAAAAAPTQAEFNALRATVVALQTALTSNGIVK